MLHHRAKMKRYEKLKKVDKKSIECAFCDPTQLAGVVDENDTMLVVKNRTPYDIFEGLLVDDHLMIIPKSHRVDFADLTEPERLDYMEFVGKYQNLNYNLYVRAPKSSTRSVAHIHTHLLHMPGKRVKTMLYLDKPYMVLHEKRLSSVANKLKKR